MTKRKNYLKHQKWMQQKRENDPLHQLHVFEQQQDYNTTVHQYLAIKVVSSYFYILSIYILIFKVLW